MKRTAQTRLGHIIRIFPALVIIGFLLANPALANNFGNTGSEILDESCSLLFSIKEWMFRVVYILGAIGLVIIAISAFLGRFRFAHLIALGGGLFIVAAADLLIDFISADQGDTTC